MQAIKKLKVLGGGFGVVTLGGQRLVSSVPHQLSTDTNAILELAQVGHRPGLKHEARVCHWIEA